MDPCIHGHHDPPFALRFAITMARFGTIHDSPDVTIHDEEKKASIHDPDYSRALTNFPGMGI